MEGRSYVDGKALCACCSHPDFDELPHLQWKACTRCGYKRCRYEFDDENGVERDQCANCRGYGFYRADSAASFAKSQRSSTYDLCSSRTEAPSRAQSMVSGSHELRPLARSRAGRAGRGRGARGSRAADPRRVASAPDLSPNLTRPDPPLVDDDGAVDIDGTALTPEDRGYMAEFHDEVDGDECAECPRCRRRWFDVGLTRGICNKCHSADDCKRPDEPFFWSKENTLDFGDVPAHLPQLSQLEEQMIARVHVHCEAMRIRGAQYKYRGHVVSFLRSVGKIYNQLPLLPQDMEHLIVRPANATNQPHVVNQYGRDYYVKRSNIRQWLDFLRVNHLAYADVEVSERRLSQLPVEGADLMHMVPQHVVADVDLGALIEPEDDLSEFPEVAAVPNRPVETDEVDLLGQRPQDRQMDWTPYVGRYAELLPLAQHFWKNNAAEHGRPVLEESSPAAADGLNPEERLLFDQFVDHYQDTHDGLEPRQLLLQVDGRGGTGKSHVIRTLSARLESMARAAARPGPIVARAAPTGVAANGINGSTVHSLLKLPITKGEMAPLTGGALSALQARLRNYQYVIVDEKSMISLRVLNQIDARLREAYPERSDEFFSGRSVMLVGDFFQLPPVLDKALYQQDPEKRSVAEVKGKACYDAFTLSIELKAVVRQRGEAQAGFREALDGLRNSNPTVDHWPLLSTRIQAALPLAEVETFKDALRIFPTNGAVGEYNLAHLEQLAEPCFMSVADNVGPRAGETEAASAGNLHNKLPLVVGARIMLLDNVWTEGGLVNGAVGTVVDLGWAPGAQPRKPDMPFVVMARFDGYSGPDVLTGVVDAPRGCGSHRGSAHLSRPPRLHEGCCRV